MSLLLGMIFKSQMKWSLSLCSHPWFSKSELIFFFFGYTSRHKAMSHWSLKLSYVALIYFELLEGKTLLISHHCIPAIWNSVLCMWRTWYMSAQWMNEWMSEWPPHDILFFKMCIPNSGSTHELLCLPISSFPKTDYCKNCNLEKILIKP